jgi:serine protease Do
MHINRLFRNPIAAALVGASIVGLPMGALYATSSPATQPIAAVSPASVPTAAAGLPDFSALVQRYGPAVVNISVKSMVKTAGMPDLSQFGPDSPFFRFMPEGPREREVPMRGQGSGFIVDGNGIILTNAHVVSGAKEVTVKLTDKREFTAKVLGADEKTDVAVLKIDAANLPTVRIGDQSEVKVGQWVFAIGAPFGFENSVTQGIVSASGRTLPDGSYVPFIQTDVAINPGNSGGPLFNLQGEVIGINSQIYSRNGGYQGVSFAIPMPVAMNVAQQLKEKGHVERGKLGIGIQGVDQSLAGSFGLDKARGALVSGVEDGSAAAAAGVKPGDVILEFNGKPIDDAGQLPLAVAQLAPGSKASITVWRDNKRHTLNVKLGATSDEQVAENDRSPASEGKLGLAVRPLSKDEQREVQVDGGLLVQDVSGPAEDAGIQSGDIVLAANATPLHSADQLKQIVAKSDHHIALLVQRGEARMFVPIQLG